MPIPADRIWSRLPSSLQATIIQDLILICEDIIHDHLGVSQPPPSSTQSDHLHSAIQPAPDDQQPGKPEAAIRAETESDGVGMERGPD